MQLWAVIILLIFTNFKLISSRHLALCIWVVAIQGLLLSSLPLLINDLTLRIGLISILTFVIKSIVCPWLLFRVLRTAGVSRETDPFVGYSTSLLVGVGLLAIATWISRQIPSLPIAPAHILVVPMAFFNTMIGLFIIVSRRTALSQVLGYLVMENGIYSFGIALALEEPLLVELGTLLDIFVAIFAMGIIIFHITHEFNHIDSDKLTILKD